MATRTMTVCDKHISNDPDDLVPAVDPVELELDGTKYTLDLCAECKVQWEAFRSQAETWKKMASHEEQVKGKPRATTEEREETSRIRTWAREQGYDIGDRGRIKPEIRDLYYERNPSVRRLTSV